MEVDSFIRHFAMDKREELIQLSGQILNGMFSADISILTKLIDRTVHKGVADAAVDIAARVLDRIDEKSRKN